MNYKIVLDEVELWNFVRWLPSLAIHECYYVSLFARKKYHDSARNDKTQCKRFTATSKDWLLRKINQLEIKVNGYSNKDGSPVHNDALALYISVNPRSFPTAQRELLKKLADTVASDNFHLNPATLAMSEIQKAKSYTAFVDFDFDGIDYADLPQIPSILNPSSYQVLKTRGGFHLLVQSILVYDSYKSSWHKELSAIPQVDVSGDNLIPIPGCTQGGFSPYFINHEESIKV